MNWTSLAQAVRAAARPGIVGRCRTRRRDRGASPRHRLDFDLLESRRVLSPVTVTIPKIEEIRGTESGLELPYDDYYARVQIDGQNADGSPSPEVKSEVNFLPAHYKYSISPYWKFTRDVPTLNPTVSINISLYDKDYFPLNPDDIIDINPDPNKNSLQLTVDLATGSWSGDVPENQGFSEGDGYDSDGKIDGIAKVFFDMSTLSTDGDADGDGLLDGWEKFGVDLVGDGTTPKLDLPGYGADPLHKDLFLELDWMPGAEPVRDEIQAMKAAFAAAPIDAGTAASALKGAGIDAKINPDGLPGINLHVDTGGLTDATGNLVGDNLGGGNQVPLANVSALNSAFYAIKQANFTDVDRSGVFRYGLSAMVFSDGLGVGDPLGFTGQSSGGNGTNTLNRSPVDAHDASRSWIQDEWKGMTVKITGGTGANQERKISSNTTTQLTVDNAWDTIPDNTSTFLIELDKGGQAEIGGNDLVVFDTLGSTLMHEFGHTLNLQHGGNDGTLYKPNYVSLMNYDHRNGVRQINGGTILDYAPARQSVGGPTTGGNTNTTLNDTHQNWAPNQWVGASVEVFDQLGTQRQFRTVTANTATQLVVNQPWATVPNNWGVNIWSYVLDTTDPVRGPAPLPELKEYRLWETQILDPNDSSNAFSYRVANNIINTWPVGGKDSDGDGVPDWGADYNFDGIRDTAPLMGGIDINGNGNDQETLVGINDWHSISLPFRQFGNAAGKPLNLEVDPPPTISEYLELEKQLNTVDLAISVIDDTDPVDQGRPLAYTLTVTNNGSNPAFGVTVVDTLPDGVVFDSARPSQGTCTQDGGEVMCDLGTVYQGVPVTIRITVTAQGSGTVTNMARVSSAYSDPDETNNTASESTTIRNVPPTAALTNGGPVDEGSTGLVMLTNPFDPSSIDIAAGFRCSYDFDNDGVFEIADSPAASAVVPASYLAVGPSIRTVRARIADKNGGFTDYTTTILINGVPPTVNVGTDATITQGDSLSRIGSFSDPGADTWTATVDYGDGSGSQPLALNADKTFRLDHSYTRPGTFPVTVVVTDGNGSVGLNSFLVVAAPLPIVPPLSQPKPSPPPMVGPVPMTTFAGQFPQVQVRSDALKTGRGPLSIDRTVNLKRPSPLGPGWVRLSQRLAVGRPHPAGPHVARLTDPGRPRSRPL